MKLGIFGGAFDPLHLGHRKIMEAALASGKISRLLVLPTGLPPHKKRVLSMAAYRYEMLRLAVEDLPQVSVSDYELSRPGIFSYTADTLLWLRNEMARKGEKKIKLSLIFGSDALENMENWYRPDLIFERAKILIALRGDDEEELFRQKAKSLETRFNGKIRFFKMPSIELSSTELREKFLKGEEDAADFPPPVWEFLQRNKPYAFQDDFQKLAPESWLRLAQLERKIAPLMPASRLIHSLNVMGYAIHLAIRHDVNPTDAATAGLLHDVAKFFPKERQLSLAREAGMGRQLNLGIAHGPAGALYARRKLGVRNRHILSAIYHHTIAKVNMSPLEKIIYLADKIEFGRDFADLQPIREAAEKDLNLALKLCLDEFLLVMARQERRMHPLTEAAWRTLQSL